MRKFIILLVMMASAQLHAYPPSGVFGAIGDSFDAIQAQILGIQFNVSCTSFTSLCDSTSIDMPTTITASGNYCLEADIVGTITIDADDVSLDLSGRTISGAGYGIEVLASHAGIRIANGFIKQTTNEGIIVRDDCSGILLEELVLAQCGNDNFPAAITLQGTTVGISGATLRDLIISDGFSGINLENTSESLIAECQILSCTQSTPSAFGISIVGTDSTRAANNVIAECQIADLGNAANLQSTGILAEDARNILIERNVIQELRADDSATGITIQGFNPVVRNCIVQRVQATNTVRGISTVRGGCIQACTVQLLSTSGSIGFLGSSSGQDLLIQESCALDIPAGVGFALVNSSVALNSTAKSCDIGFETLLQALVIGSVADGCTTGFQVNNGLSIFCDNCALAGTTGFNDVMSTGSFYNNVESLNPTGYSGVVSGPIAAAGDPFAAGFNLNG